MMMNLSHLGKCNFEPKRNNLIEKVFSSEKYRTHLDGNPGISTKGARMSPRNDFFCRFLFIPLTFLSMLTVASPMFAKKLDPGNIGKGSSFPVSNAVAMPSPAQESLVLKFQVDESERRKEGAYDYHFLNGWILIEDQATRGQKVYVQFEKPDGTFAYYSTLPVERRDVGAYFKNELYNASGFTAKIPLNNISDITACTIRFVVKNQSGIFKSTVWKFGISSRLEIRLQAPESLAVKYDVKQSEERKEGTSGHYSLYGWIYVDDQECLGQKVYVQFEKPDGAFVYYSTMPVERADVRARMKNELYYSSGFNAKIPLKDMLDIDSCTIRFVVKNKNGIFKSRIWKYGISPRVDITLPGQDSRAVDYYLAVKEVRGKGEAVHYYLTGWVYVKNQDTKNQEVYAQLKKPDGAVLHYLAWQVARPEVGIGFNNPLYEYSGFFAKIPLQKGLDINTCMIRLVVRNKSGTYRSHEWKKGLKSDDGAGKWSVFVAVNWLLVLMTSMILIAAIWRDRSLLVKPSIMAVLFFHVMCQWGTAIQAGRVESVLPHPWAFVLLSHGFPLIGLIVSLFTARGSVRLLWQRVTKDNPGDPEKKTWAWAILALFFFGFVVVYLNHVPFRSTGLYKIFTSPAESNHARDMSVKFLANPFLRYGYSIAMTVFSPLLAVLTTQLLVMQLHRRKWFLALLCFSCLGGILIASSLSGARGYSAFLVLAGIFYLLLRKGFPLKSTYLISGILLVVILPTLLTVLREGATVTAKNLLGSLRGSIFKRIVIIPMETGLLHVHYAQTHGYFGVQAIPKLATVVGIEPLNVANFVGKMYYGDPLTTMTANASYIYSYYSYFGLWAFLPCLLGLWLLDLSLLVYQKLSANMLIPCVVCTSLATIKFSSTEFTIGLFSKGFLFILLVSWVVDRAIPKIDRIVTPGRPAGGKVKPGEGGSK